MPLYYHVTNKINLRTIYQSGLRVERCNGVAVAIASSQLKLGQGNRYGRNYQRPFEDQNRPRENAIFFYTSLESAQKSIDEGPEAINEVILEVEIEATVHDDSKDEKNSIYVTQNIEPSKISKILAPDTSLFLYSDGKSPCHLQPTYMTIYREFKSQYAYMQSKKRKAPTITTPPADTNTRIPAAAAQSICPAPPLRKFRHAASETKKNPAAPAAGIADGNPAAKKMKLS